MSKCEWRITYSVTESPPPSVPCRKKFSKAHENKFLKVVCQRTLIASDEKKSLNSFSVVESVRVSQRKSISKSSWGLRLIHCALDEIVDDAMKVRLGRVLGNRNISVLSKRGERKLAPKYFRVKVLVYQGTIVGCAYALSDPCGVGDFYSRCGVFR